MRVPSPSRRPALWNGRGDGHGADDVVQSFERLSRSGARGVLGRRSSERRRVCRGRRRSPHPVTFPGASITHRSSPLWPMSNAWMVPMRAMLIADSSCDPDSETLGTGPSSGCRPQPGRVMGIRSQPSLLAQRVYPKLDQIKVEDHYGRPGACCRASPTARSTSPCSRMFDAPLVLEKGSGGRRDGYPGHDRLFAHRRQRDLGRGEADQRRRRFASTWRSTASRSVRSPSAAGTPTAATPPGSPSRAIRARCSAARDLDRARQILADNGAEDLSFTLIPSPYLPQIPLIAQVIQQNLAEIGVDVEIAQLEVGDWQTRVFSDNPAPSTRRCHGSPATPTRRWW